jgi:uncharacterized small protein (DUF1192 family)
MSNLSLSAITEAIKEGFKAAFNTEEAVAEVNAEVATEEVATAEAVEEPTVENSFDVDAFKKELAEMLGEFSKQIDTKLEGVKTELSAKVAEKEQEIETLNAELAKQPEVKPVKPLAGVTEVKLTKQGRILNLLRNNK